MCADIHPNLTALVEGARRGFRRDVAALEAALDEEDLFIPLAKKIANVPEGEDVPLDREMEIVPHYLADAEGARHVALFTSHELVASAAARLGWTTDGEELAFCALPGRIACQLALDLLDEETVLGLVIDAGHPSELVLRRAELASIVSGKPIPLVGYVADIPPADDEKTLIAEPSDPPPPELTALVASAVAGIDEVTGHHLVRTFNLERDLEPHLTLRVVVRKGADRRAVADRVIDAVGDSIPPPGYLDIVFDDG